MWTMDRILVTKPSMPSYEEYIEAIKPLWESQWLTNMGMYHQKLEDELKKYLKVSNLSLVVNGHMALELAIKAFDFPEGKEVITTPFTFISTTHAIVRNKLKPVFCDVKDSDGTIDEEKIERLITDDTVAIVPVHVYGNVCNVKKIKEIAKKYKLKVIYDAAHAFGVECGGIGIGNFGDASAFSFHSTKIFNTIEGGAIVFEDKKMCEKIRILRNFGIKNEEVVSDIGCNAKMNEFCAIMGLCNLKHINEIITRRRAIGEYYKEKLSMVKGIRYLETGLADSSNFAYFPIVLMDDATVSRDILYERLRENEIYARKYFYPLTSQQACYYGKYNTNDIPCAQKMSDNVLALPMYEKITKENLDRVIYTLKKYLY
jgi:dTDP-4-amino-4,6-dideoxygalactose transaminase